MDRRRSVCVHESSHWVMARFLGMTLRGAEINKKGNDTEGRVLTGFAGPLPERKQKNTFWRNLEFQRFIQFDSSGLLGEFVFSGSDDFWQMNSKKLLMDSQDCYSLKRYAKEESISKEEYQTLLESTSNYLMLPTTWSFVMFLADKLLATTGIYNLPDLEKLQLSLSPQSKPDELIEFFMKELYK